MGSRIKKKTTRRKNTSVKRRNQSVKRSVKRRNKTSKRTNMKRGGLKIYHDEHDEQIGEGEQGTAIKMVYEIEKSDNHLPNIAENVGKKVCFVKKIFPDFVEQTNDKERALHREISYMMDLDHPNIIKMYSWGWDKDSAGNIIHPYIIMDYFNCIDLKHMIQKKKLVATYPDRGCSKNTLSDSIGYNFTHLFGTESMGVRDEGARGDSLYGGGTQNFTVTSDIKHQIIKEIFNGMQYLHENNIIHCDIKPANIFLNIDLENNNKLEVVIGDLGLALKVDDINSENISLDGKPRGGAGSRPYCPKEMNRGTDQSRTLLSQDYYAFGVVILQVLLMRDIIGEVARSPTPRTRRRFGRRDNINPLTYIYSLYLKYIDDYFRSSNPFGIALKNLLYIPGDGEEYPIILQKRREAFGDISRITGGPQWNTEVNFNRQTHQNHYYNIYTNESVTERPVESALDAVDRSVVVDGSVAGI
jgi:serine/threonine protein kinase